MDYMELAKSVVKSAASDGVEVEAYINHTLETIVRVSEDQVEQLSQASSHGIGVRVIDGGRTGYAYTSDFSDAGIEQTWRTAIELAKIATPDPNRALPELQTIPDAADLEIWDDELPNLPIQTKIEMAKRIERAALGYDKRVFQTDRCTYSDDVGHVYLANSRGFAGQYGRTIAAAFISSIAKGDDGEMRGTYGFGASTYFSDLDAEAIGREASEKAISILGGKPIPTQTASIVLDHVVGAQILIALAQALSAESWQKRRSFLMDRMGQQIGSDMVTLIDNGRMKRGVASAPFDGEGVPTSATRLVDEGVLQNLMYDTYSARKANVGSTGNAQRSSHRGAPSLAPSNFYLQPGHLSREAIIEGTEQGMYVIEVMQTGGVDPITGDCSMGANGLWIENGKIVGPVGGVTLATTLDSFMSNIAEVGGDLRMIPFFGNIGVPTLRVNNVTIGGTN